MDTMKEIGKHENIINLIGACTQNGEDVLLNFNLVIHDAVVNVLTEERDGYYSWSIESG